MHPWQELRAPILQLQCHLRAAGLLMQEHLGWSHQVQQVTQPKVVWINLLHLDTAHEKPITNSHGDTIILVSKQVPGCLTSGMHGLVFMPYQVCTMLYGEVQCEYTLLTPSHICKTPLILALRGIPSM